MIAVIVAEVGAMLSPDVGWLLPASAVVAVIAFPRLRRGPDSSSRDVWRGFGHAPRRTVLARAGDRCEGVARSGAMNPPWWYVLGLERRRRGYFPKGVDVRVLSVMSVEDVAARA